jgi:hypothetical protein
MAFLCTLARLSRAVDRQETWFDLVTQDEPALAQFGSPERLIDALEGSWLTSEAREEVFSALMRVQYAAPSPLWEAILLVAFGPMLLRLRTQPRTDSVLDQLGLFRFVDAIAQVADGSDIDRIDVRIRLLASRASFRLADQIAGVDDADRADPFAARLQRSGTQLLTLPPSDPGVRSLLDAVERAALRTLVRLRHRRASPREQERLYVRELRRCRLLRGRARVIR